MRREDRAKNALLVRAPGSARTGSWWPLASVGREKSAHVPPVILALLARWLSTQGYNCRIVDYPAAGLGWGSFVADLVKFTPCLLIIDSSLPTLAIDLAAAREARRTLPAATIVLCGRDLLYEEARIHKSCPELDGVLSDPVGLLLGEGREGGFEQGAGLQSFRRGRTVTIRSFGAASLRDFRSLPRPAWELLDPRCYGDGRPARTAVPVLASVGCRHSCLHCIVPWISDGAAHFAKPSSIVAQMRWSVLNGHQKHFRLITDNLAAPRPWWFDLTLGLSRSGLGVSWEFQTCEGEFDEALAASLRDAGCSKVTIILPCAGQEGLKNISFGPGRSLSDYGKGVATLKRAGVAVCLGFVIGPEWTDEDAIREAGRFARQCQAAALDFFDGESTAGSRLADIARRKALQAGPEWQSSWATCQDSWSQRKRLAASVKRRFLLRPANILAAIRRSGLSGLASLGAC